MIRLQCRQGVQTMDGTKLTASEWNILNFLWESGPSTVMQIVGEMERTVGWARSTTVTTLTRMEAKGLVRREQASQGKPYIPLVERNQAALVETHSFLNRVYQGSVGIMTIATAGSATSRPMEPSFAAMRWVWVGAAFPACAIRRRRAGRSTARRSIGLPSPPTMAAMDLTWRIWRTLWLLSGIAPRRNFRRR